MVILDNQPIDDANEHVIEVGHAEEVQGQTVIDQVEVAEMDVTHIADEVANTNEVPIIDEAETPEVKVTATAST